MPLEQEAKKMIAHTITKARTIILMEYFNLM
jgi:hypothetical protein